jgi:hypothetical protein
MACFVIEKERLFEMALCITVVMYRRPAGGQTAIEKHRKSFQRTFAVYVEQLQ